ncbi:MAG: PDZ domain-containing protein [Acidobacteriota bacterium]
MKRIALSTLILAGLAMGGAVWAQDDEHRVVVISQNVEITEDDEGVIDCRAISVSDGAEQELRCELREGSDGLTRAVFFNAQGEEVEIEGESKLNWLTQSLRNRPLILGDHSSHDQRFDLQIFGLDEPGKPRGFLGLRLTDLTPELRRFFGVAETAGVLVAQVTPGGPADRAGVRVGDVLTALDGKDVVASRDLRRLVRAYQEGDPVVLEIYRDRRLQKVTAEITLRAVPEADIRQFLWRSQQDAGDASGNAFTYRLDSGGAAAAIVDLQKTLERGEGLFPQPSCGPLEKRLEELEKKILELSQRLEGR